ncbi:RagB/SusD family nutrient uptake outer membrane protein [Dyadobacter sp. 50-39]|uniref:RagB/SusD family nutrient uptake outer membrane protein n=1 Tax=Dyadobacter sp. 50-39 TaxID=1895756 RepID=UPI000B195C4D|nr:RagB/SusD family nutrient uptake outer membrane protein [Dyadobacter sp. 50-39]
MKINKCFCQILFVLTPPLLVSCGDTDWLDVKRYKADVMPHTFADLQAIMDNHFVVNLNYPVLGQISADDIYIPDDRLNSASVAERNAYIWAKDIYQGAASSEFAGPNEKISYANIVLERLPLADQTSESERAGIKGQALFLRSFATYQLAQLFCKAYDPATAGQDPGLQLRASSDPNLTSQRSTVQQTYDRILADALEAVELLPQQQPYRTRPTKAAAHGMLAKAYLVMGMFQQALNHADLALKDQAKILDFNSDIIQPSSTYRFPSFTAQRSNPEILFHAESMGLASVNPSQAITFIDSGLTSSYQNNDLRKTLFFRVDAQGRFQHVGRYTGTARVFTGIAANEMLLIQAECHARLGNTTEAISRLNLLLKNRFKAGTFTELQVSDKDSALNLILSERRKELVFTGQARWEDLRRLAKERPMPLRRRANGMEYALLPGDKRYVLPFPDLEIQLSGILQNQR